MAEKRKHYLTPEKLVFSFPHLVKADQKYKCFSVKLRGTPEQIAKLEAMIKPEADAAIAELQKNKKYAKFPVEFPFADEFDKDENPTGNRLAKFKQNETITFTKNNKEETINMTVDLFDSKGVKIERKPGLSIGGGTEGKVSFTIFVNAHEGSKKIFVSLRPVAVQIIKHVAGGGGKSAADHGFSEEEGGFTAGGGNEFTDESNGEAEASPTNNQKETNTNGKAGNSDFE